MSTGGESTYRILDINGTVDYRGSWDLNLFTTPRTSGNQTSHSTAENTSSIFVSFYGSQIQVLGIIPPGQGSLSANYTIDNGEAHTGQIASLNQAAPLYRQPFYISPVLPTDRHNATVDVTETGIDRNYTFQMFKVSGIKDSNSTHVKETSVDSDGKHNNHHGSNSAAIVGGVLGSVIFLPVGLFALYFWNRKRLARISDIRSKKSPEGCFNEASYTETQSRHDSGSVFPALDPFMLPERGTTASLNRASIGDRPDSTLTSPPAYRTVDGRSSRSVDARSLPSVARASRADSPVLRP